MNTHSPLFRLGAFVSSVANNGCSGPAPPASAIPLEPPPHSPRFQGFHPLPRIWKPKHMTD